MGVTVLCVRRQKEYKIKNLQNEIDRIVAKEKLEAGLTPGQTSTLARNEQVGFSSGSDSQTKIGRDLCKKKKTKSL